MAAPRIHTIVSHVSHGAFFIPLVTLLMMVSCGRTARRAPSAPAIGGECTVAQVPAAIADTLRIALQHAVDISQAPVPNHYSDRLLYRQLYETLIRVDCTGRVTPSLAQAWRRKDGGRRWSFTLRSDARFWDGTPVTAALVVDSWRETGSAELHGLNPDSLFVDGGRVLEVVFARPLQSVPSLFAATEMAVIRRTTGVAWPVGTGPYQISRYDAGRVVVEPAADRRGGKPTLEFQAVRGRDPRDVIDDRYDLVITSDARSLDYAAAKPDRDLVALPWDASYVFAAARAGGTREQTADVRLGLPVEMREELARDAVRIDARASTPPSWWDQLADCHIKPAEHQVASERPQQGSARIAFESADAVARGLAERIVALAGAAGGRELLQQLGVERELAESVASGMTRLQAVALSKEDYGRELLSGNSMAYVLPLQRLSMAPCRSASDLVARASWMVPSGSTEGGATVLQLGRVVVPLVDTRRHAVVYRGSMGLAVDWDAVPILLVP
ncbi:MAG: hypothetical protein JSW51_05805 [Gemmatimonadota bacterium]|nr:MAG: hypothetical protein JSW51_05805 [Gemmatimonadota bacterium]